MFHATYSMCRFTLTMYNVSTSGFVLFGTQLIYSCDRNIYVLKYGLLFRKLLFLQHLVQQKYL